MRNTVKNFLKVKENSLDLNWQLFPDLDATHDRIAPVVDLPAKNLH